MEIEEANGLTAAFSSSSEERSRRNSNKESTPPKEEDTEYNQSSSRGDPTFKQSQSIDENRLLRESSKGITPTEDRSLGDLGNRNNNNKSTNKGRNNTINKKTEPLSSSTPLLLTSENEENKRKPVVDITPMQIEVLPNVKNTEILGVQQRDGEITGRVISPVSFISEPDDCIVSQTPVSIPDAILVQSSTTQDQSNSLIEDQFTFADTFDEMTLEVKKDAFLKVFVSEVVNPGLFYVHLVSPQAAKLDEMMESLNVFYTKNGM